MMLGARTDVDVGNKGINNNTGSSDGYITVFAAFAPWLSWIAAFVGLSMTRRGARLVILIYFS